MRFILFTIIMITSLTSFAQQAVSSDSLQIPVYDTTSIELRSTNFFPFCSKNYSIPRDCEKVDQSNCCEFTTHISRWQTKFLTGQFSCSEGTSLFWIYYENEEEARTSCENLLEQFKKQMKTIDVVKINCFLVDKEVSGYKIKYETTQGYKGFEIVVYGTINGQSVYVQLISMKEFSCNDDIPSTIRKIIRF